jgi:alkylation response protein AidB-like acyl-CoA dehydrogenase
MPLKDEKGDYLPGITVRPIYDALGRYRWDEIFFDNVRVPARNILGEENRGWYAAMTTLSFERSNIDRPIGLIRLIEHFVDYCRELKAMTGWSPLDSPVARNELADWRLGVEAARMVSYRVAWIQSQGEIPGREANMTKWWGDHNTQGLYRFLSRLLGDYGLLLPGNRQRLPLNGYLNANAFSAITVSLAGGTTEVQKNIIAQRGLGLPR